MPERMVAPVGEPVAGLLEYDAVACRDPQHEALADGLDLRDLRDRGVGEQPGKPVDRAEAHRVQPGEPAGEPIPAAAAWPEARTARMFGNGSVRVGAPAARLKVMPPRLSGGMGCRRRTGRASTAEVAAGFTLRRPPASYQRQAAGWLIVVRASSAEIARIACAGDHLA
jgi:hypothetical protein